VRRRRQISSPNGSIANLFVTRKSLVTRNSESAFSVPFPAADDRIDLTRMQIKSRRWKGAGCGSNGIICRHRRRERSLDYFWTFA
jgi:hypothetical protein